MNPWTERNQLRKELAYLRGLAAERLDTINDQAAVISGLQHQLATSGRVSQQMRERGDRILAQLYDLQRQLVAAPTDTMAVAEAVGVVPHLGITPMPACVDAWADGGEPCPACKLLLPAHRPKETPGLQPAPPTSLPTYQPLRCKDCGEPLQPQLAHYCRKAVA